MIVDSNQIACYSIIEQDLVPSNGYSESSYFSHHLWLPDYHMTLNDFSFELVFVACHVYQPILDLLSRFSTMILLGRGKSYLDTHRYGFYSSDFASLTYTIFHWYLP